jgi:hypothetical protein
MTMVLGTGFRFLLLVPLLLSAALTAATDALERIAPVPGFVWQIASILLSIGVITLLFANDLQDPSGREGPMERLALYLGRREAASTYGAAGALVLVLTWVYYSSLILLSKPSSHRPTPAGREIASRRHCPEALRAGGEFRRLAGPYGVGPLCASVHRRTARVAPLSMGGSLIPSRRFVEAPSGAKGTPARWHGRCTLGSAGVTAAIGRFARTSGWSGRAARSRNGCASSHAARSREPAGFAAVVASL